MHLRFCDSDRREDVFGQLFLRGRDLVRAVDELKDIAQSAMRMLFRMFHREIDRTETAASDRIELQFHSRQFQRRNSGAEQGRIDSGIDEC